MGRQPTSRRPLSHGYCSRTASALTTVVPLDPNNPIEVSAPLPRFTRYSVDCAAPVGLQRRNGEAVLAAHDVEATFEREAWCRH